MDTRVQDPYPRIAQLFCDRFYKDSSYSTWRSRGSGDWLLIYTDGGAGQFGTRLGTFEASSGEVVLYAPGDAQDYKTAPSRLYWELMWVHFRPRPNWNMWLQWPRHENGLKYLNLSSDENRDSFRDALERMRDLSRRSFPGALDFATNALEEALLWANLAASRTTALFLPDERIRQATDYLSAHLDEPFHLEKLATRCGLSVSRFAHLFKEQTGVTPQQFLESKRMEHASHLLRLTGMSVTEVAREAGYSDPFYFSNRFRRHIGQSPLRFRQQRELEEI